VPDEDAGALVVWLEVTADCDCTPLPPVEPPEDAEELVDWLDVLPAEVLAGDATIPVKPRAICRLRISEMFALTLVPCRAAVT
jgi:hypothetical protein